MSTQQRIGHVTSTTKINPGDTTWVVLDKLDKINGDCFSLIVCMKRDEPGDKQERYQGIYLSRDNLVELHSLLTFALEENR